MGAHRAGTGPEDGWHGPCSSARPPRRAHRAPRALWFSPAAQASRGLLEAAIRYDKASALVTFVFPSCTLGSPFQGPVGDHVCTCQRRQRSEVPQLCGRAACAPDPRHRHLGLGVRSEVRAAILLASRSLAPRAGLGQCRLATGPHVPWKEVGDGTRRRTGSAFTGHRKQRLRHGGLEDHLVRGPPGAREHLRGPEGERAPRLARPSGRGVCEIGLRILRAERAPSGHRIWPRSSPCFLPTDEGGLYNFSPLDPTVTAPRGRGCRPWGLQTK